MSKDIYRITYLNQGEVYEIYARHFAQAPILGFVEIGGLLFGERTALVVDPSEEKLKAHFEGVSRFFVPMHAIIRVDVVEKQGVAKITEAPQSGSNVTPFPVFTPGNDSRSR